MTETPKQSDQLPEEGPAEQVPDDVPAAGEGAARESSQQDAREHAHDPPSEGAARESSQQDAREHAHDPPSESGYRDDAEQEAYERATPDAADEEVGGG